ncbi:alpha/beta fold hydrolase [Nakamurella sp. YIM 132087]|uniref:Alpha/beta fold hydrolase n=1 Tax=Nakamurella alba TaxID=2665158 RepID=A0A7K1FW54_9ACTN|nr:alpha/beta hydrolase [Nakamurella alba]MTD17443.1 alpha/beta fold hydrolase [Nakamurella alba]
MAEDFQVAVDSGAGDGVVTGTAAGPPDGDTVLFLHGWPQSRHSWADTLDLAAADGHRALAIDLPGIGDSASARTDGSKVALAVVVGEVLAAVHARRPVLVGTDVGGMTTYAALRSVPGLRAAVIMDVAVPGVEPWPSVVANPHIWHFAFHTVPDLPETMVGGREAPYFDYFFDILSADRGAVSPRSREASVAAYATHERLAAGFDFYRTFGADEKANTAAAQIPVTTPLLYLRGEHEWGDIDVYDKGFRAAGITDLTTGIIDGSGHYAADENPEAVWRLVSGFLATH